MVKKVLLAALLGAVVMLGSAQVGYLTPGTLTDSTTTGRPGATVPDAAHAPPGTTPAPPPPGTAIPGAPADPAGTPSPTNAAVTGPSSPHPAPRADRPAAGSTGQRAATSRGSDAGSEEDRDDPPARSGGSSGGAERPASRPDSGSSNGSSDGSSAGAGVRVCLERLLDGTCVRVGLG